jgi:hypothetical protein
MFSLILNLYYTFSVRESAAAVDTTVYYTMNVCTSSSSDQCDDSLPEVLLLVSSEFPQWVKPGPARRCHRIMLKVRVADSVTTVRKIAAEYYCQSKHFYAVCLASTHGAETQPQLKWKHGGHMTLTAISVKAVAKITQRMHIITCWLLLHKIIVCSVGTTHG